MTITPFFQRLVLPIAFAWTLASSPAQNLIQNGSFESPVVPTGSILGIGIIPGSATFIDAGAPNNGITNWSVTQGTVSIIDNGATVVNALGLLSPPDGNQFAVLNSLSISALGAITVGGLGTLQQSFTTVAGNAYQVTFEYAGLGLNVGNGTAALQVSVTNSRGSTAPNGGNINVTLNSFQNQTFDFVATGTNSTLIFDEPTGSLAHANGVGLDSVSVLDLGMTAVPEMPGSAGVAAGLLILLAGSHLLARRSSTGVSDAGLTGAGSAEC